MKILENNTYSLKGTRELILPSLKHLDRLTDDTGVFQFAIHSVPNPCFGYTLDDNARALLVTSMYYHHNVDCDVATSLTYKYLSFLRWSQLSNGWFHNELSYDRHWLDERGSEDAYGRAVWALGYAATHPIHRAIAGAATEMLRLALPQAETLKYQRGFAYTILGLVNLIEQGHPLGNCGLLKYLADNLYDKLEYDLQTGWYWFEDKLTYDNGRLPQSLMLAGHLLGNSHLLEASERSLSFLLSHVFEGDVLVPIGNNGWFHRNSQKARYDQQPIDAATIVEVCATAWRIFQKKEYLNYANLAWEWFHGQNSEQLVLYDLETGGCHDGLGRNNISNNQGSESSIAFLQASLALYNLPPISTQVDTPSQDSMSMMNPKN